MIQASGEQRNRGLAMLSGLLALLLLLVGGATRAAPDAATWAFDLLARVEQWRPTGPLDFLPNAAKDRPVPTAAQARIQAGYSRLPMHFEPNLGQTADEVKFVARGPGYTLFLTADEAVLALRQRQRSSDRGHRRHPPLLPEPALAQTEEAPSPGTVVRMRLEGAVRNAEPHLEGLERLPGISNYFLGNDPAKWRTNVPHYRRVKYQGVYPGIDLVYYGNPRQLEYDFVLAPGADPNDIRLVFEGVEGMRVADNGDLILQVAGGELVQKAPKVYQEVDGERRELAGHYVLLTSDHERLAFTSALEASGMVVSFQLASHDTQRTLVIDPLLQATYLGGSKDDPDWSDNEISMAIGPLGVYVAAQTESIDFPKTAGGAQSYFNVEETGRVYDVFIALLSSDLKTLYQATYLGGTCNNLTADKALAIGTQGIYITGQTCSIDFPGTTGNANAGYGDGFAALLSHDLRTLIHATYWGGSSYEDIYSIAIGANGVYVAGVTQSLDLPATAEGARPNHSDLTWDGFVTLLSLDLATTKQATYLGCGGPRSLAVGSDGIYAAGMTSSDSDACSSSTAGGFQETNAGRWENFIFLLSPDLKRIIQGTYLGGSGYEDAINIAISPLGIYVEGDTESQNFPGTAGGAQTYNRGGWDAYVALLSRDLKTLKNATYFGGNDLDAGWGFSIGADGVYIVGRTDSTNLPGTANGVQPNLIGRSDAYIAHISSDLKMIKGATYLGGSDSEQAIALAFGSSGILYVAGITYSMDFPGTAGGAQNTHAGYEFNMDTFVACYDTLSQGDSGGGVGGCGTGGTPPALLSTPEQPVYGDPPPPVTVPPEKSKHLVLLIHGWNSDPYTWANSMKTNIVNQLKGKGYSEDGDACYKSLENSNSSWQICTYDWSSFAKSPLTPWGAYVNALNVGKDLAAKIVYEQRSYDFIHFIAHSAGSQVAETAATWLKIFIDMHNAKPGDSLTQPVIHTTFLDAYDPLGSSSNYGASSDWAEQYVDMRRVGDLLLDDTDIMLPSSYNFDITALDQTGNNVLGTEAHAWPYKWYDGTIKNPTNSDYGFSLSLESGRDQFPSNFPKGGKCVFFSSISTVCSENGVLAGIAAVRVVIDDIFDVPRAIIDATISPTGSVFFLPSKIIKLITGSPAWVSLPIAVTEPIDVLSFDYTYLRQAEGLLSVFFDDQLVFRSDERVEPAGLNHSDNVPIGAIASGAHTLSFRLDAYNNTQSEIDISRIQLGKMEVSASPVDATPPVITPTVSGTQGNNGWYKSDVTVSWTVVDGESAITTQSGCGTTTVTTDTSGVTFTCSATSGGGPASKSVTIQRDATSPTITGSASPNANGWRNSAVTVSFTCTDATSQIATCPASQTLGEGANQLVSGTATDKAGNSASTSLTGINIDLTPPVVSVTGVTDGATYILGAVPTAGCDTKDALSGVQTNATPSVTGGDANGLGTFTARCTGATDKAGNAAGAASVTYQVNGTPPTASSTFSAFSVNPLRINQRLKTLFLLSNFTLGQNSNGIDPAKEPVTLTIAGFTATIPPGSFRKGPAGVYAFAGKINTVSIEALIAPLGNNRFGFQAAAYGVSLSGIQNPVSVALMIGDDSGTTTVNNAIIR